MRLLGIQQRAGYVDRFRVEARTLQYYQGGTVGRAYPYGVIELDWGVLTPTRIRPVLIHEMIHALGFKRWRASLGAELDEQMLENRRGFDNHGANFIAELKRLYALGVATGRHARPRRMNSFGEPGSDPEDGARVEDMRMRTRSARSGRGRPR